MKLPVFAVASLIVTLAVCGLIWMNQRIIVADVYLSTETLSVKRCVYREIPLLNIQLGPKVTTFQETQLSKALENAGVTCLSPSVRDEWLFAYQSRRIGGTRHGPGNGFYRKMYDGGREQILVMSIRDDPDRSAEFWCKFLRFLREGDLDSAQRAQSGEVGRLTE